MLSTEVCGLKLKNPTILASGILGTVGSSLRRVAEFGAGAVVTKSIGAIARAGYKNPTVIELEYGLLNAVGLSNPGYMDFRIELEVAKQGNVPVIASVYGFNVGEFIEVAKAMENYGADAIELNLSCPNVEKAGTYFGQDNELAFEVTEAVKKAVSVPVMPKLTVNTDVVPIAKACAEAGCDGIVAINAVRAMKIDVNIAKPVLSNKVGGLSGPAIKPIALAAVYDIAKNVDMTIIACGGITTGKDAAEFLMAGASAVEIGSAVHFRGVEVFKLVQEELAAFMEERGYKALKDLVGAAL